MTRISPMKLLTIILFLAGCLAAAQGPKDPPLVPDSSTAINLARVLLVPIYGERFVRRKTFSAKETDGVWTIIGRPIVKEGRKMTGGVIEVRINAADVRVSYLNLQL